MNLGPYLLGPNNTPENGIYTGDARELAKAIPDESVDLIHTDPPYAKEYLCLWPHLAKYASRILKPNGSLIALTGQAYLLDKLNALAQCLDYHWIGWILHTQKQSIYGWRIVCGGKPLAWFSKGTPKIDYGFWWDTRRPSGPDKRLHKWGQPTDYILPDLLLLTDESSILFDPFCGGGTTPAACVQMNRRYLAFEIDPTTAEIARERVRNTQPPLFVPEPQQLTIGV